MIQIIMEILENPNVLFIMPMIIVIVIAIIVIAADKSGNNTKTSSVLSFIFLAFTLCVFFIVIDWETVCSPLKAKYA